jgi:hypothetical protein
VAESTAASEEIQRKPQRWYWVLAASVATLALVGAFLAWKARHTAPPLATEQRVTSNPPEAAVTSSAISPALVLTNSEPKVTFLAVKDKSTREVELKGFSHVNTVDWTADSKSVYLVAQAKSGTDSIVEVEPSGNQRVLLEADKNTGFWWAIQSPDGRHVIIEQLIGENNVWMIENF